MKRFYLSKLLFLVAILSGGGLSSIAQITTYNTPGSYTYTVGAGVTSLSIDMMGACGGTGYSGFGNGGKGARVQATLAVTPGQVLTVYVGGRGGNAPLCCTYGTAGGFNGGGNSQFYYGASGGGGTDIRTGGVALANRVLVAGGGGGAGYGCSLTTGGDGGFNGTAGMYCSSSTYSTSYNGQGGTQTAGGQRGLSGCNTDGSFGQGGLGSSCIYSGGGGGGWYGGGGGYYAGGGGGSSYAGAGTSGVTYTTGYNTSTSGDGSVTIIGPTVTSTVTAMAFGNIVVGSSSLSQVTNLSGVNLSSSPLTITPPTGFEVSLDGATWSSTAINMTITTPSFAPTPLYIRFSPGSYSAYSANVVISGGGAAPSNIAVTGTGDFPCSGTPTAGTAAVTPTSGSSGTIFALSLTGTSTGGGLNYQWQRSSFAGFGYTDIPGANTPAYNQTGISGNTYFRCVVTCPYTGGGSSNSTAVLATAVLSAPACRPTCNYATSTCGNSFYVGTAGLPFTLTGASGTSINDGTACPNTAYLDQTATMGCTLNMGSTYTATVGGITGNTCANQIWIDFNGDGTFSTSEVVGGEASVTSRRSTPTITIPSTVTPGLYRMRVILSYCASYAPGANINYANYPQIPSCPTTTNYYIDARDYAIRIQGPGCAGAPVTTPITADVSGACTSFNSNLLYTPPGITSGFTYQWQRSVTSGTTGFSNVVGATNALYTTPTISTGTVWYRNNVTCSNGGLTTASDPIQLDLLATPAAITGSSNVCMPATTALSSATTGGTWSSSNPTVATVGFGTGIVRGVAPGVATITYTAAGGCYTTKVVNVSNGAAAITGSSSVCAGLNVTLSDVSTGGVWSNTTGNAIVNSTTGVVTGVTPGSDAIVYTLPSGCTATLPIVVNPVPAAISGTANVCIGSTTALTNATAGGTWSSSTFAATVDPSTGVVTGVSVGTPNIIYRLATGCQATMPVTVNSLPTAISGATNACVGLTSSLTSSGTGVWTTADPSVATVDAGGVVTGVAAGATTVNYSLTGTGCSTSSSFVVNALPAVNNVTGGGGYCSSIGGGVHIGLDGSATGIDYQLFYGSAMEGLPVHGSTSGLDFGVLSGVGTYTVMATNVATGCTRDMAGSATVVANPAPSAVNLTGGGNYCVGGNGVLVTTDASEAGVSYQLYYGGLPMGLPVAGTGAGISFGLQTALGGYTAIATNLSTLCTTNLVGSPVVGTNPNPVALSVAGGGNYCSGALGSDVYVSGATEATVQYQLYHGITPIGLPLTGTGADLHFGPQATTGGYTVVARDPLTACQTNMTGSVTIGINPLPTVYTITGGGNYCAGGTGVHVGLNSSTVGTNYQLMLGGSPDGAPVAGTNAGLDFGLKLTSGAYSVVASIASTGCSADMAGVTSVGTNMPPYPYNVTGGGGYCAGGTGVAVTIDGSESGVNYQLYRGITPVGPAMPGTSGSLSLGIQTVPGTYTVKATNPSTTCTADLIGGTVVSINPLPAVHTVTGSGNYCAGDPDGKHIFLSTSTASNIYQVYSLSGPVGPSVIGTGTTLDLGGFTTPGVYTVVASDGITPCTSNMNGSATVGVNPLPAAYEVTGGGNFCAGGTGVRVGLRVSNTGVNYQLVRDLVPVSGAILPGTGFSLDFGLQTVAGNYTVQAINATNLCTNAMIGSVAVVVNPLPTPFTVTGGGQLCAGATGVNVILDGSATGISYQLYRGTTAVGTAMPGDGFPVDFGAFTTAGTYTVKAVDVAFGCRNDMMASATVIVNALPTAYSVTGGGNYCAGGAGRAVGLSNSNSGIIYQLKLDGAPVGSPDTSTGGALDFGLQTAAGNYTVEAVNPATTCGNSMTGTRAIAIDATVTPAVTVATSTGSSVICVGSSARLTASAVNGGSAPTYQWRVNGGAVVSTSSSYDYTPANGDSVSVTLTSNANCVSPATADNHAILAVNAMAAPAVTISAGATAKPCPGTAVTINATPTNGGTAPGYQWLNNGVPVATGAAYSYTTAAGDIISCVMTSNFECRTMNSVYSNNVVIDDAPVTPVFSLNSDLGTNVGKGLNVTFSADATVPGVAPTYVWKKNGTVIPTATGSTYSTFTLVNNDVISCDMTSHSACGTRTSSKSLTITVNTVGVQSVANTASDVKIMPNPNKGTFTVKGSIGSINDQDVTLEVVNMVGQVVYATIVKANGGNINEQITLNSGLANGMYILNMRSASANNVFHFVIER